MIVALPTLFYFAATIFVLLGKPFGSLGNEFSMPTCIGMFVFMLFGLLFLCFRERKWQIVVLRNDRASKIALWASLLIGAWLMVIVARYGQPAPFFLLRGEIPPSAILHGAYRELLPLRAFFPPLVVSLAVTTILGYSGGLKQKIALNVTGCMIIAFVGIYETRHVIIWIAIYWLMVRFFYINQLVKCRIRLRHLAVFSLLIFVFIAIGNARSGLTFADGERFASAMAVDDRYINLPMVAIWGLIYLFSSFARGIANDPYVPYFNYDVPQKLFPGFLQNPDPVSNIKLSDRFADQMFAVDAWHTYTLQFGIIGALILILLIMCSYLGLCLKFDSMLKKGASVPGWFFALLLWCSVRIGLLAIGDYILDFAAFIELTFLILFFHIVKLRLFVCPLVR